MEIAKSAAEEARSLGNDRLLASALGQMGRIAMWSTDDAAAVRYVGEALEISRRLGDKKALIFNLRQMGNAIVGTEPGRARTFHEESVQLAREAGDRRAEATGLNSMAIAIQLEGDKKKSLAVYAQALELNRAHKDRMGTAMVLSNMAGVSAIIGDLDAAERIAKESIAISIEIGSPSTLPTAQVALADTFIRRGRYPEALSQIRELAEGLKTMGVPPFAVAILAGILKVRTGDRKKGRAWIGFSRAHDPSRREIEDHIESYADDIRGDDSKEEVEAAMRAGEGLKLEDIVAEVEQGGL
ncbi:MAG TPA: tetratricopeptide repeat protein [Candidatus Eisenbacteria bacterium]|nr:tetratricopeptide repeat protein [Candidatus Eisenbacteria bacterium]